MGDWKQWSDWLREGYYISYLREGVRYYEHIIERDFAHYMYQWPETVSSEETSGPFVPDDLELTTGYNVEANTNHVWQMIFGIKGQVFIYVELPTDIHRHGVPKRPKPSNTLREVSHFEEYMSPFHEPSFLTEHFLMRPELYRINFDAYNPNEIDLPDLELNVFIAKMVTERIGTEQYGELTTPVVKSPTITAKLETRWSQTLQKLYQRQIPHRPITLLPVRAPAEAPAGQ